MSAVSVESDFWMFGSARHWCVQVVGGDQNYHYENVAFICDETGETLRLAPMLDHEFSTYFMFPDSWERHIYCLKELERSIEGDKVQPEEYAWIKNVKERKMTEKSAEPESSLYQRALYENM